MKKLYTLLLATLLIASITDVSAQIIPCTLVGAVVTVPYSAPPIMMHAAVNGMSQYTFGWNDGTPVGSSSQKPFYSGWCVTITDIMTGCDTTICESCIPTGGAGICTQIYMPVCGCDGNIYSNDCVAMNNGIFTYTSAIGPNGNTLPCTVPLPSWDCINGVCIDPNTGTGAYPSLSVCQTACTVVTPSWGCDITFGNCFLWTGPGQGTYTSQAACQIACSTVPPTWDCDPSTGICSDPGGGTGFYPDSLVCATVCGVNTGSWDCDPLIGICSDPGGGMGLYPTLADCQNNCVISTWNCIGNACIDPGTGQGLYASLSACDTVCAATAINEKISDLLIYPNPAKNTLIIIGNYTSVTIYDVFRKVVLTTDYQYTIDVAALSNGVYFMCINTNNAITVKKIIIAK